MKTISIYSHRFYLLRTIYNWLISNKYTPYILVDTTQSHIQIPQKQTNDNRRIILNISTKAVENLKLGNTELNFQASFNHIPFHIKIPIKAVLAIYAQENGIGMEFGLEDSYNTNIETAAINLSHINNKNLTAFHKLILINNTSKKINNNLSDDYESQRKQKGKYPALRVIK
ncbi:stringent starvation protein B [Candidatus Fukatsuia anoeciicola]|uniref:stringent starvation protein B n=1 Tax=Candidatus Fukatsuia anoeciicola TaxID=2994492 RepID=UPI0034646D01